MEIVKDVDQLRRYMSDAVRVSGRNPVLIDQFLPDAVEVDVDAISDGISTHVAGVMQHIELAGIHSGDSACSLPPYSLPTDTIGELKRQTCELAAGLGVVGLMNVQFAVRDGEVNVLEVNPRASRTVPFVAKSTGSPIASIAARVMAGETLAEFSLRPAETPHFSVKEVVLPFARFPGVDALLGPEMRSTGEVMGLDSSFELAFLKAQIGAGMELPSAGNIFVSIKDADKTDRMLDAIESVHRLGYGISATRGTAAFLARRAIDCSTVNKIYEGRPNIVDSLKNGDMALVINTTDGRQTVADSHTIRTAAIAENVPYCTTAAAAQVIARVLNARSAAPLDVRSLQSI